MSIDHLVAAVQDLDIHDQIDHGLRWIGRTVAESGRNCASTFTLLEWLREHRANLVIAGDRRVSDLAD